MSRKIYRATEYDYEIYTQLIDHASKVYDSVVEVGVNDVTIGELATAIDSELENANYHSLSGIGEYMARKFTEAVGEEKAKELLWSICQDKGFVWRF